MSIFKKSLQLHYKCCGKIEIKSKVPLKNKNDLSLAYTPGVAEVCRQIARDNKLVYKYTSKNNLVAVVTDGSAVLGLGNIGAKASLPVMEGKAILFKELGGVDAFPIAIDSQDVDIIVDTVKRISPVFGGINLEDISAPRCFEIERRLIKELDIPVFHDDQHGTAIVVLAGLINALKIVRKKFSQVRIVINGAGAAGIAVTKLLLAYGFKNIIILDTTGIIYEGRKNGMNWAKDEIAKVTNLEKTKGDLSIAIKNEDIFIGLSAGNVLTVKMVKSMAKDAIIFAMANPIPEIMPDKAIAGGAVIIATGRSDFANQVNNVLAFPGIFRGLLDARISKVTEEMKIAVAKTIAGYVKKPNEKMILPNPLDRNLPKKIALAIRKSASKKV